MVINDDDKSVTLTNTKVEENIAETKSVTKSIELELKLSSNGPHYKQKCTTYYCIANQILG